MTNTAAYAQPGAQIQTGNMLPAFRRISTADIPLLYEYFSRFPTRSCDFSIGGVLMWAAFFDYRYAVYKDSLLLTGYDREHDRLLCYQPAGPLSAREAMEIYRRLAGYERKQGCYISLEESLPEETDLSSDTDQGQYIRKWAEYLYPVERFLTFSGKKMEKKRNHLNYFTNHYPEVTVGKIDTDTIGELIGFCMEFMRRHDGADNLAVYETEQTIKVLAGFSHYPFEGILLRDHGKIIGFTFGEIVGDTFHVHVEKGDTDYHGIYQALASQLAAAVAAVHPDVAYLNREEDMGNENLRKSKLSYHPVRLVNKRCRRFNRQPPAMS